MSGYDCQIPEIDFDSTDLTSTEKSQLYDLLTQFADLFAFKGGPVQPLNTTEGPPIRQPLQRHSRVYVVSTEVTKQQQPMVIPNCDGEEKGCILTILRGLPQTELGHSPGCLPAATD